MAIADSQKEFDLANQLFRSPGGVPLSQEDLFRFIQQQQAAGRPLGNFGTDVVGVAGPGTGGGEAGIGGAGAGLTGPTPASPSSSGLPDLSMPSGIVGKGGVVNFENAGRVAGGFVPMPGLNAVTSIALGKLGQMIDNAIAGRSAPATNRAGDTGLTPSEAELAAEAEHGPAPEVDMEAALAAPATQSFDPSNPATFSNPANASFDTSGPAGGTAANGGFPSGPGGSPSNAAPGFSAGQAGGSSPSDTNTNATTSDGSTSGQGGAGGVGSPGGDTSGEAGSGFRRGGVVRKPTSRAQRVRDFEKKYGKVAI